MSQRTESPPSEDRPEFSGEYLLSLVLATAFVLILVFVATPLIGDPLGVHNIDRPSAMPWLYPWILAAGQTISNGLTEFSGKVPGPVESGFRTAALVGLLLVGVVAPTLCLLLMQTQTGERARPGRRGMYLFGLIISGTFALMMVPTGYNSYSVRLSLREAQAVQTNKDLMINELNVIAWRMREYRVLPKSVGGGSGALDGFAVPAGSGEATYVVKPLSTGVVVEATSKRYADGKIEVTVREDGGMWGWKYSGAFQ